MMRTVCVLGLGYVGLPTAAMLATCGLQVTGVDVDSRVLSLLYEGQTRRKERDLDTLVRAAVQSGNLTGSEIPVRADVFVIAVPTPIRENRTADLGAVLAATRSVAGVLQSGNLVVLESTV